jgi:hypothetical protein
MIGPAATELLPTGYGPCECWSSAPAQAVAMRTVRRPSPDPTADVYVDQPVADEDHRPGHKALHGESPDFPLGVELEVLIRREDAERFLEEARGGDPDLASYLRNEERELEAGGLN